MEQQGVIEMAILIIYLLQYKTNYYFKRYFGYSYMITPIRS
jgi:hypothetical protein